LNVIDYIDSTEPTERKPVNIPGRVTGLSHNGAVIHTVGQHWTTNWYSDGTEWLDASAYDGVEVHLVDSLSLSNAWPHPVLVDAPSVFVGRSGYLSGSTNVNPHLLETWALSDTGKFARLGAVTLNQPASTITTFPGMLAVQTTDSKTILFNKANPGALLKVGEGRPPGCVWTDLEHSDGALDRGLWLPLGAYGVTRIPVTP
jgi:hypothetical protein